MRRQIHQMSCAAHSVIPAAVTCIGDQIDRVAPAAAARLRRVAVTRRVALAIRPQLVAESVAAPALSVPLETGIVVAFAQPLAFLRRHVVRVALEYGQRARRRIGVATDVLRNEVGAVAPATPTDPSPTFNVLVRDTCNGAPAGCVPSTTRLSASFGGTPGDGPSGDPALSGDGRFMSFTSYSSNLVPGGTPPGTGNIYLAPAH
jgi:hypothetical protein